jgi:hypothetical protein
MSYLLLDREGEIVGEFEGLQDALERPEELRELRREHGRLKVVRVDEHPGSVVSATSWVTTTSLSEVLRQQRRRA